MNILDNENYLKYLYQDLHELIKDDFEHVSVSNIILTDERRVSSLKNLERFQVNPYLDGVTTHNDVAWNNLKDDIKSRILVPFIIKKDDNGTYVLEGIHRFIMLQELIDSGDISADIKIPCTYRQRDIEYADLIRIINRISSSIPNYVAPKWMCYK